MEHSVEHTCISLRRAGKQSLLVFKYVVGVLTLLEIRREDEVLKIPLVRVAFLEEVSCHQNVIWKYLNDKIFVLLFCKFFIIMLTFTLHNETKTKSSTILSKKTEM